MLVSAPIRVSPNLELHCLSSLDTNQLLKKIEYLKVDDVDVDMQR